jgi:hypothetical protein
MKSKESTKWISASKLMHNRSESHFEILENYQFFRKNYKAKLLLNYWPLGSLLGSNFTKIKELLSLQKKFQTDFSQFCAKSAQLWSPSLVEQFKLQYTKGQETARQIRRKRDFFLFLSLKFLSVFYWPFRVQAKVIKFRGVNEAHDRTLSPLVPIIYYSEN